MSVSEGWKASWCIVSAEKKILIITMEIKLYQIIIFCYNNCSMNADVLRSINITLDAYGFLLVLVMLAGMLKRNTKRHKVNIWLVLTTISAEVCSFSDIFTWICDGTDKVWYPAGLHISTFIFFLSAYGMIFLYALYLLDYIGGTILTKKCRYIAYLTFIIYLCILIPTPFTGWIYSIDADNHYSRGPLLFIPLALQIILYFSLFKFFFQNRDFVQFSNLKTELAFIVIPQAMQIIQIIFYGISLSSVGYSLSLTIIFLDINRRLERNYDEIFDVVRQRDTKLIQIQNHTILSLSSLVEERDTDTGGHVQRTSDYVGILSTLLMNNGMYKNTIDENFIRRIIDAAPMHDIGKIVVPDAVLKKPGKLTAEEYELMKLHATEGGRIIREVLGEYEDREYKRIATNIATYHHEKWDGTGYPRGLKADSIPLCARIMALADVFDALVSPRVYKEPMSYEKAFEIIEKGSGVHFDPNITKVFIENKQIMIKVNEGYIQSQKAHLNENTDNDIEIVGYLEEIEKV